MKTSKFRAARLAVVIPMADDWASLSVLIPVLVCALADIVFDVTVLVIDDGSTREIDLTQVIQLRSTRVVAAVKL